MRSLFSALAQSLIICFHNRFVHLQTIQISDQQFTSNKYLSGTPQSTAGVSLKTVSVGTGLLQLYHCFPENGNANV
jgi:hypothetical protein